MQVATTVGDATQTAVTATTGAVKTAAYFTPGLKRTVASYVHSGFWEAYLGVREFVHRSLRKELVDYPGHVYFCGHSLGGALATIAALDVKLHTLPRVNAYLAMLRYVSVLVVVVCVLRGGRGSRVKEMAGGGGIPTPSTVPRQSAWSSRQFLQQNLPVSPPPPHISVDSAGSALSDKPSVKSAEHNPSAISVPPKHTHNRFYADAAAGNRASDLPSSLSSRESVERWRATRPVRRVKASMYNFGSPRVGNAVFTHQYNQQLPDSFRVVVDGDIVCGIPKGGYKHVGTEVMIDSLGAGSIIIDPSYVERRLRTRTKANVSVHSLIVYRKGLEGVKAASLYMRSHVSLMGDQPDTIRLAINAGPLGLRDYQGFDVISDADKAEEPEVKEDVLVDPERGRARGVDSDNSSAAGAASVESRLPLVSTSSSVLSSPRNTVVQESAVGSMESAQILERAVAGGNRGQPLSPGVSTRSVKMPATTEPIDEKEARHLENDMIQNASLFAAINREKPSMLQSLRSVVIGGSKKKTADDQDLTLSTSASPMAAAPSRPALPVRHSESSLDRPATGHRSPIQGNAVL